MDPLMKNSETESNFFIKSFFESLSNFVKNVKIEIKDIFELLNYPCVYHNNKKKFSINDYEDHKNSITTNIISKIDKKNIDNFRQYQNKLEKILENIKMLNEKYKMDVPLLFIIENLITLHLINEYKINNIVKKIQDHNISMPELSSDLPNNLIQTLEVEEDENQNYLYDRLKETNNLSINSYAVKQLIENANIRINFSKIEEPNKERYFNTNQIKYSANYLNKSYDSGIFKTEKDEINLSEEPNNLIDSMMKEDEISSIHHTNEKQDNVNTIPNKIDEKQNIIENIGLSEETLKLLNLLPKKKKEEDN
ncbi:hypothetical protein YYC_00303 [Plasmodium yoelii 17X]|uniref:Uncharacterized protein n=4 Tax=Plasmodium yoelii TaxID=5861 RepID=A0AAE9WUT3_PLAYO|nr:conserved Plasmodium protein, unknown function [Plasmodium yoelii]ETB62576.1 hypothetical protein YYC_00303 [Plasmodium yoelii 17X]WBY60430.1 hypothetical protein Py17XNL_001303512 [Plasmodium yoelii yoelii]CDU20291.1 conserved Plasmodium protein, unknown function [Plasmodium yoelii]VTZ81049.1 conserved Plasmodium protein, unknown function [Plasmodium yoelii]|eukprot:XP_729061.2 conserved Plasmodium protein, unknown function [Plasmodium yoelii]